MNQDEGENRLKEIKRRTTLPDAAAGSLKKTQTKLGKSEKKKWTENVLVKEEEEDDDEDYERRHEVFDNKDSETAHETISRCPSLIQRVCESLSKVNTSLSRNVRAPMTLSAFCPASVASRGRMF